MVRLLVEEHGAAVDARDGALCTSLHAASEGGHPGMVVLLLQLGAQINARNRNKQTPLHYACGYAFLFCFIYFVCLVNYLFVQLVKYFI